jgi:hypothetical protein
VRAGTFRLAFDGETSQAIAYNTNAADVESVLEALNAVDEVTVTGSAGGPWTVTFGVCPCDSCLGMTDSSWLRQSRDNLRHSFERQRPSNGRRRRGPHVRQRGANDLLRLRRGEPVDVRERPGFRLRLDV